MRTFTIITLFISIVMMVYGLMNIKDAGVEGYKTIEEMIPMFLVFGSIGIMTMIIIAWMFRLSRK